MHVISRPALRRFSRSHADAAGALDSWYKVASKATWKNLTEVQSDYPSSEAVGGFTVFNIKGNHYRLIISIDYPGQAIFIKYVLTHAEYDKDKWKNDPYF
ncbi:MAG: type II toxin-antitoxin system HigB family toxin [Synechococcus sp.]